MAIAKTWDAATASWVPVTVGGDLSTYKLKDVQLEQSIDDLRDEFDGHTHGPIQSEIVNTLPISPINGQECFYQTAARD